MAPLMQTSLLLVLLLLVVVLNGAAVRAQSPASPLRVLVPDLAGMLYPMQSQQPQSQYVDFGSSHDANLFPSLNDVNADDAGFTGVATAGSNAPCDAAKFCVDLVFTSDFEADPFLLARYESKLPVNSSLLDEEMLVNTSTTIQPVITGNYRSNNTSGDDYQAAQVQTWWRFSTNASDVSSQLLSIDVLLRFKQLSQFRSKKDELLIHFVATRTNELSATTAIECFTLYGNARVAHETSRVDSKRLQIAFKIERDSSKRDVLVQDAYPVLVSSDDANANVTTGYWIYTQQQCMTYAMSLYNCTSIEDFGTGLCNYDTTSVPFVKCMRENYQQTSAWFKSQIETQSVGTEIPIESILSNCFDQAITETENSDPSSWVGSIWAMSGLAAFNCPVGPFKSMFGDEQHPDKMLVLTNTTEYVHNVRIPKYSFSGFFQVTFSLSGSATNSSSTGAAGNSVVLVTSVLTENSTESEIVAAIHTAFPMEGLGILVEKSFNDGEWKLNVDFFNVLFPNFESRFILDSSATTAVAETHAMKSFSTFQVAAFDSTKFFYADNACQLCADKLDQCRQSDQCREQVLPCLTRRFTDMLTTQQSQMTYVPTTGKNRLDVLAVFTECTTGVPMATWDSVRRAFLCFAQRGCNAGTSPVTNAPTGIKIGNGTQVFVVKQDAGADTVTLNFSRANADGSLQSYRFQSSIPSLPLFIRAFLLESGGDVVQSSRVNPLDSSKVEITLEYFNLLGALPKIGAASGISWTQNAPVKVYFEYTSDDDEGGSGRPSLTALLELLGLKAEPLSSVGTQSNHSWVLAPECVSCSVRLFACASENVKNRTCHYDSMASPFGRCLREQLPSSVYAELLGTSRYSTSSSYNNTSSYNNSTSAGSSSNTSLESAQSSSSSTFMIRSEISNCARQIGIALSSDPATNNRTASTVDINAALGCFAMTKCPFGPLDIVENNPVVLLDTSSYIHVLRIHARKFQITLEFKFADDIAAFAQVPLDDSISRVDVLRLLTSKLAPSGVIPSVSTFESKAGGAEWTIDIRYDSVVLPGFSVTIASNSVPTKSAIEQILMKSSPRLITAPRNPFKMSKQLDGRTSTFRNATNTTNGVNGVTASDVGFAGYFPCPDCPDSLLEACRKSHYCHLTVLPCLVQRLGATSPAVWGVSNELDVTDWILSCAATPSGIAFYNWWAPLQRFLACYARAQCKVSRSWIYLSDEAGVPEISPTTLKLQQGEEMLLVPIDAATGTFSLDVLAPAKGTNFLPQNTFTFNGNSSTLEALLIYITMDTAGSVIVTPGEPNSDGLVLVKIVYGDDYLGMLPQISPRNGGFSYGARQPRLVLTSPSVSSQFPLDWSGLLEALRNSSSQPTSGPGCSECEQQFLRVCHNSIVCSQQILPSLQTNVLGNSMGTVDYDMLRAVRDTFPGILAASYPLSEWKPIQDFLVCFDQAQCQTNGATITATTANSYMRLRRGRIRFLLPSPTDAFSATLTVPVGFGNVYSREFEGSLEDLRVMLESLTGSNASVSVQTWHPESFPANLYQIQVTYDEFYGTIPSLSVTSSPSVSSQTGSVWRWQPQLVLFSSSDQTPSADGLSSTFARYSSRLECNTICSDHLNICIKGDSRESLVCREVILPCLNDLLASGISPQTTPTDFSTGLRFCTEKNILAGATPMADFFMCYEQSKCPLNFQDGNSVPTYLQISDGIEIIRFPNDPVTLTIYLPSYSSPVQYAFVDEFEFSSDVVALQNYLQNKVLELRAIVQVQVTLVNSDYTELQITYKKYLGNLPSITGLNVVSITRVLPRALTVSGSTTAVQRWGLFKSRLQDQVYKVNLQRSFCSACAGIHLTGCSECSSILTCLAQKLHSPVSSEVVATSASSTGTNFTAAFRSCVSDSGYTAGHWRGLGDFFGCLMTNGCQVGSESLGSSAANASYVVAQNGFATFEVENDLLPLPLTISAPPELLGAVVSSTLDPTDGFAQFSWDLNNLLVSANAGYNLVAVADGQLWRDSVFTRNFSVAYSNYYGLLPVLGGSGLTVLTKQSASFSFQSLNGVAQWDHFLGMVASYLVVTPPPAETPPPPASTPAPPPASTPAPPPASTPAPPPASTPTRVLVNTCAQCGADLFDCDLSAIADGSCSYATATSLFMQCLASDLDAAAYQYLISQGFGSAELDIKNQLSTCYASIQSTDESAAASVFTGDLWYAASNGLACFDSNGCPLGPLDASTTSDYMVHLESTMSTRVFTIDSETFSATFTATYGFRVLTSSEFTQTTTDEALGTLIIEIMPSHAEVVISMKVTPDGLGFEVTLEVSQLYFPDFEIQIVVGTTTVTGSVEEAWNSKLVMNPIDSDTMTVLP